MFYEAPMAYQADNTLISNREMIGELLVAPFRWIYGGLMYMAENSYHAQALSRINKLTDEELAARGLTRAEAVREAMNYYL